MCIGVLSLMCVGISHVCLVSTEAREGGEPPETGVHSCEQACGSWELDAGSLENKPVFLC